MANLHQPARVVATTADEDGAHLTIWVEHGVANSYRRSVAPAAARALGAGRHFEAMSAAARVGRGPVTNPTRLVDLGLVHDCWTGPVTRPDCCVTGARFRIE